MSAREISQLQKDLSELENGLTVSDSTQQLRTELTNLRNKVHAYPYLTTILWDVLVTALSRNLRQRVKVLVKNCTVRYIKRYEREKEQEFASDESISVCNKTGAIIA